MPEESFGEGLTEIRWFEKVAEKELSLKIRKWRKSRNAA